MSDLDWTWYEEGLPWKSMRPVSVTLNDNSTFVAAEVLFISFALCCLLHALGHGRQHFLIWVCALVTGCVNDIFFMMLPFVDNFWHAQATVMLTARLPLYIPCAYIAFVYVSTVAAWRLRLSPFAQSACTGLTGCLFYSIYDLVGAKFLWWTWHDTDAAIAERWMGVPVGSTMWTAVHCFCFSYLLHHYALCLPRLSVSRFLSSVIVSAVATTPFMMVSMGPFQLYQLRIDVQALSDFKLSIPQFPGRPDPLSLLLVIVFFSVCVLRARSQKTTEAAKTPDYMWLGPKVNLKLCSLNLDRFLLLCVYFYFASLVSIMTVGHPGSVVATSVHQTVGECYVKEADLSGYVRYAHLCPSDYQEDFLIGSSCGTDLPELGSSWYLVCGKPHQRYPLYVGTAASLALLGSLAYTAMLTPPASSKNKQQ